ncbi:MAG: TonB-dependent receptor, partial [Planctomycetales bacterium]
MVDHIEVLRGQGSVLWGSDAIGGAINVVTRGADPTRRFHGGYRGLEFHEYYNTADSSSYSRLNVEGWADRIGYWGGGAYSNVNDLDTGWPFGRQPGTHYQQYAGDIKLNYLLGCNQMLTFALQHNVQQNLPRSDRFPGFPGDLNNSNSSAGARFFDPQQRDLAYLRYQALEPFALSDALTFTASYHRQREVQSRIYRVPPRFQETDVESTGLNLVSSKELGSLGRIVTGADWYHDDVDSAAENGSIIIPDDAYYERIGVFTQWNVDLTDRLGATAGVRYENIQTAATPLIDDGTGTQVPTPFNLNFNDWIGSVGLVYEINPCVNAVGSISEGFRAPNLDELAANNPNVLQMGMSLPQLNLVPENSVTYEVGLKTNYEDVRTQTFVFWTDLGDNIVAAPTPTPNSFGRANQDSFVQGVEFDGEYLLDRGWSLYGNFWYVHGINRVTNSPLSRVPPAQGIAGLRWRDPNGPGYFSVYTWLVRRQDRLEQVRDITDERIPPGGTPGYATLNMRMGRAFGCDDQHRLSLGLENITDKAYLVHGSGVFGT